METINLYIISPIPWSHIGHICLRHKVLRYPLRDRSPRVPLPPFRFTVGRIVAADAQIRAQIDQAINANEVRDVNPLGVVLVGRKVSS